MAGSVRAGKVQWLVDTNCIIFLPIYKDRDNRCDFDSKWLRPVNDSRSWCESVQRHAKCLPQAPHSLAYKSSRWKAEIGAAFCFREDRTLSTSGWLNTVQLLEVLSLGQKGKPAHLFLPMSAADTREDLHTMIFDAANAVSTLTVWVLP